MAASISPHATRAAVIKSQLDLDIQRLRDENKVLEISLDYDSSTVSMGRPTMKRHTASSSRTRPNLMADALLGTPPSAQPPSRHRHASAASNTYRAADAAASFGGSLYMSAQDAAAGSKSREEGLQKEMPSLFRPLNQSAMHYRIVLLNGKFKKSWLKT